MRTAIVILNWNGRHWLERTLPLVLAHSHGAEVVVADNGSTDDTLAWLSAAHPTVRQVPLATNLGFAGGYNAALAQVEADRYVLLNSDVEATPGWLDPLHALLDREPRMAACQPKVLALHARGRFEHAGAAGGFIDRNGYPFCRGRIFDLTEEDHGQYDDERHVFWATGACMMIRADAFHATGGFHAELFAHMEEIDLCWRLRRTGHTIGYTSASTVYHAGGGTLGYGSPRKTYLNFRNSLIVLVRNLRRSSPWLFIPRRLVLDLCAALKFLLEGHSAHAWQVLRAHAHFLASLPQAMHQRRELQAQEHEPDLTGMYLRSIAYDRFILGWKRFSDLDLAAFVQGRRNR
ncbi:MAG: glycosyltransferase family 2 protein [Flavobacteriales bacterium]|nr:glycosyltransferase family 2 protein [Flavobacteriales bacterium]